MLNNDKAKSNFFNSNSNHNSQQYLSTFATASKIVKNSSFNISKKDLSLLDFIKQKHKFNIKNNFDENGTKLFLDSKEIALKEIKLNDEMKCTNNIYSDKINKDEHLSKINIGNKSLCEEVEEKNKKMKKKIHKEKTTSPKRNKKEKKEKEEKKINKVRTDKNFKTGNIDFDSNKINNIDSSSNNSELDNSNYIYKFIIENANESEDDFNKKIQKEIKRVETKKMIRNKKNSVTSNKNGNIFSSSLSTKKNAKENKIKRNFSQKSIKKKSNFNGFDFSESIKNLMSNEVINVSSINSDTSQSKNQNQTKKLSIFNADDKNKKSKNNLLTEKDMVDKDNAINDIEINSSHESLMSILSGLM